MAYWLFKSEPDAISFQSLLDKRPADEEWHGIRNYGARNNMRLMQVGERGFFYHSNIGKEIVGIVEVTRQSRPEMGGTATFGFAGEWINVAFHKPGKITLAFSYGNNSNPTIKGGVVVFREP